MGRREGSSPRVRGKLTRFTADDAGPGLIPACAGKTGGIRYRLCAYWAHPRVCGENGSAYFGASGVPGSSPRVRGKLVGRMTVEARGGLIPACAGKTFLVAMRRQGLSAHPRVCGENFNLTGEDEAGLGSSPRVRGKRRGGRAWPLEDRLIPACAGKTS